MRILVVVENADDTVLLVLSIVFRSPAFSLLIGQIEGCSLFSNEWLIFPGEISG